MSGFCSFSLFWYELECVIDWLALRWNATNAVSKEGRFVV